MGKALTTAACLLASAVLAAGCYQPMYTAKADSLKNPRQVKAPKIVTTEPEPTFIDSCNVDFTAKPTKKRNAPTSQRLTVAGNSALQPTIATSARPSTRSSIHSVQDAIEKYRQALLEDPYNAEATLKLALAYDRVLRKGCALAMLKRLDALASNASFERDAVPMVELVVQNPHWFRPYHNDAMKAVGR